MTEISTTDLIRKQQQIVGCNIWEWRENSVLSLMQCSFAVEQL